MTSSTLRRRQAAVGAQAGEWAAVSGAGAWRVEKVGKQQLTRRTGLPPRDLRALVSAMSASYPSSIMGRERAVVVNLEHIRAIITASEVLVPGPRHPAVAPLVRELRARLASTPTTSPATVTSPSPSPSPPQGAARGMDRSVSSPAMHHGGEGIGKDRHPLRGDKALPFEFRALEVCLEFACISLEHETSTLEKEAYPALDELTSKVSALNLERVRQIKSRLVAISGRVQKVRDELEHLLDDETDMAALHLTEKLAYQATGQSSRFGTEKDATELDRPEKIFLHKEEEEVEGGGAGDETLVGSFRPNIDELEILLESYFVQTDSALNKLSALREYVDDTEDYINMMLDDKQNQLLQMGILLSTATLVISCAIAVTGVLGINIRISLYDAPTGVFWRAAGGIVGGGVALYLAALLCYKRTGILQ
ncbi:hypothetical protein GUJ93_ZPchr0014g47272 [Zizania palustris]|uniref:Magnesium transporter n=1 Tax=Zizania palustris TaxID=103762 RepID=A0A8J5W6R4_ZIZPA|nr:hypothetical protein GUJ93_ZPchr0014g47272 [Zizania palustris]